MFDDDNLVELIHVLMEDDLIKEAISCHKFNDCEWVIDKVYNNNIINKPCFEHLINHAKLYLKTKIID